MNNKREVVITGIGPILPNCNHRNDFWTQIQSDLSQISKIDNPASPGNSILAGCIRGFDSERQLSQVPKKFREKYSRHIQHYLASVYTALEDANLDITLVSPERVGIYEASSRGAIEYNDNKIRQEQDSSALNVYSLNSLINGINGQSAGILASLLSVTGPILSLTGTCSGGALAAGHAFRDIQAGIIDKAITTGHDNALVPSLFSTYEKSGILRSGENIQSSGIRPYGPKQESTLIFGEGAVTLILEEATQAKARGVEILAKISSFANGNEGCHPLRVGENLDVSVRLLDTLVTSRKISRSNIDFVVGHGNGAVLSDVAEMKLRDLYFGDREIPWMSIKPIYGHSLACSSSVSIAAVTLMLHNKSIIQPPNSKQMDRLTESLCDYGTAFSWGMGGTITALLLESISQHEV